MNTERARQFNAETAALVEAAKKAAKKQRSGLTRNQVQMAQFKVRGACALAESLPQSITRLRALTECADAIEVLSRCTDWDSRALCERFTAAVVHSAAPVTRLRVNAKGELTGA
jgi:hypothetical protein